MPALLDLTGQRKGNGIVLGRALTRDGRPRSRNGQPLWRFRCDRCGRITFIRGNCLRNGATKSCGCGRSWRALDLTGQRKGHLTAQDRTGTKTRGSLNWRCRCDCGRTIVVSAANFSRGVTTHCGCQNARLIDLRGQRFGRLVVLRRNGSRQGSACWLCRCDCGRMTTVRGDCLRNKVTRSCGRCRNQRTAIRPGDRYGTQVVLEEVHPKGKKCSNGFWRCRCDCGRITVVRGNNLRSGNSKSCGRCPRQPRAANGQFAAMGPRPEDAAACRTTPTPPRPRWDADRRELWYGETLCKRYAARAQRQTTILAAFEEEEWPAHIDDPLDPGLLAEVLANLNRGLPDAPIRFRGEGTGEGICWEPRE
jgi:hypothetical protein